MPPGHGKLTSSWHCAVRGSAPGSIAQKDVTGVAAASCRLTSSLAPSAACSSAYVHACVQAKIAAHAMLAPVKPGVRP